MYRTIKSEHYIQQPAHQNIFKKNLIKGVYIFFNVSNSFVFIVIKQSF